MEAVVCLLLMLAMIGGSEGAWCVCRSDVSDTSLQKTLDYACGAGADCTPVTQGGVCYNPNTVRAHCSYAANSYYQRKGQTQQACDFAGTATLSSTDPSGSGCTYPATTSAAGTGTSTPTTTNNPGSTTTQPGSTTTPTGLIPTTGTGTGTGIGTGTGTGMGTGSGTGVMGGLGPSGNSISTDTSNGGFSPEAAMGSLLAIILSGLVMLRG